MMLAAGLSVLIIPLFVLLIMEAVSADGYEEDREMPTVAPLVIEAEEQEHSVVDLISLYSKSGIVVKVKGGEVLGKINQSERIFPASLTKIMTCIVTIENTDDLEKIVPVSEEVYSRMAEENASMAGFFPGEEARVIDLLYGCILPSGGECSVALAEAVSGSEEEFTKLMNAKAEELGMRDTHFTNAVGLHDEEHFSTVEDISTLLLYALKNDRFKEIFCSESYSVPPTNRHYAGFTFQSSMFSLRDNWNLSVGRIIGGKTGYTDEAGLCLASLACIGGEEYIVVTAGADGDHGTEPYHVYDAINIYNMI